MAKLALVADCHIANHRRWGGPVEGGINQRGWECVKVLELAAAAALRHSCAAMFVLGDLFDNTRPSPSLVAATIRSLKAAHMPVYVILGNHDRQSMHALDQACASMEAVADIHVVTEPQLVRGLMAATGGVEIGMVPYALGEAKDWLAAGMAAIEWQHSERIVLTHCGIWDDDTPAYMKATKDSVGLGHVRWLCDAHQVKFFAAGNWHDPASWRPDTVGRPLVVIPGTLIPHNFSDPQEHGRVVIYDTVSIQWTAIKLPTPLFLKSIMLSNRSNEILIETIRNHYSAADAARAYVRLTVDNGNAANALQLRDSIIARWPMTVVHIEVGEKAPERAVKDAARAAISANESGATLMEYAELTEVEEPGTRDGVARRLGEYRKAST